MYGHVGVWIVDQCLELTIIIENANCYGKGYGNPAVLFCLKGWA